MRVAAIPNLDPASYVRHTTHGESRVWIEKNCYIDIWIELLHAARFEPIAMLPFVLAIDFEGDQWTFYKPKHDELRDLYGVDVQELNMWRPIVDQAPEFLAAGKLLSLEADAWNLPDTSGTDYKTKHTKTTIVLNDIDLENRRLGYFHNAGYHWLEGDDFVTTLRVGAPEDPNYMPYFGEFVRLDRADRKPLETLKRESALLAEKHLGRRPKDNPVERWGARFERDLAWLTKEGLAFYHAWAFGTTRQVGSAFELAAIYSRWLGEGHANAAAFEDAATAFDKISNGMKTFILKGARAVNAKKPLDAKPIFDDAAAAWSAGVGALERALS
ncbi:MAG: DUF1839 family protein [Polyangiaceae bacterium]